MVVNFFDGVVFVFFISSGGKDVCIYVSVYV